MAIAVTSDLSDISSCDALTSGGQWYRLAGTSSANPAADLDAMVQNTGCVANKCGATTSADVGSHFNHTSTFDLTSKMLYYWRQIVTPGNMLAKASQGITLGLTNTSTTSTSAWSTTNYKKWYMDGNDTMPITPGWKPYCLDPTAAADESSGTLTIASVKNAGFICRQGSGITTTVSNQFVDAVRMGTGVTLTTSAGGDVADMEDIYAEDNVTTNRWGVVTKQLGIYYAAGKIIIGATGQSNVCTFTDASQVLVWRKNIVPDTFYEIKPQGASGNKTTVTLTGWIIRGEAGQKWNINATTYGDWKSYNCALSDIATAALNAASVISGGSVGASGKITTNGATVSGVTFTGQTADQLSIASTGEMASVSGNSFTKNGTNNAVEIIGAAGTYVWDNTLSGYTSGTTGNGVQITGGSITGNEAIHVTATSGTFSISVADGASIPSVSSAGAVVNVTANQVTVGVTVLDDVTGSALQYAHVYLCKVSDKSQILNGETNASGYVSTALDYSADVPVMGWARQMDLSGTDYEAKSIAGTITASGFSTTVRLSPI